jgi:hypothetical protein
MLDRAQHNPKIKFLTQYGGGRSFRRRPDTWSPACACEEIATGEVWEQEVDGFFVAIGHIPNTKVFKGQIETDADGYISPKAARAPIFRRLPRRRRAGSRLPAGHHGLGRGLHGGHRSGTVSGSGRTLNMIERFSPPGVPAPRGPYSPAVRAGDFIYVSGQVPVDPVTGQAVDWAMSRHETRQVLTNIRAFWKAAARPWRTW